LFLHQINDVLVLDLPQFRNWDLSRFEFAARFKEFCWP
jgi:hypothetical protein